MRYAVTLGPFQPGWPGTLSVGMDVEDGLVRAARPTSLGPAPRRPEQWAGLSLEEGLATIERLCAASSVAHVLAYCQALETVAGLEPPPRARYLRLVLAEMERIAAHLQTAGRVLRLAGLPHQAGEMADLREEVVAAGRQLTGRRFFAGLVLPGGLQRDLEGLAELAAFLRQIKGRIYRLTQRIISNRAAVAPLIGAGLLTREQAEEQGVAGPAARAAELERDLRREQPYAAYGELDAQAATQGGGDAFSRWMVHVLEILESLRLLESALAGLPPGPVHAGEINMPAGEAQSRVEAPAGPLSVRVRVDEAGRLGALWRIPASPAHLAVLPQALAGQHLELVAVIVASWGLCAPCMTR